MLTIYTPNCFVEEKRYIVTTIFHKFLGLDFNLMFQNRLDTTIKLENLEIIMPDAFSKISNQEWLTTRSLPKQPLDVWEYPNYRKNSKLISGKLPIIYGDLSYAKKIDSTEKVYLPVDIFMSSFFMLTRYEEYVTNERDEFGRFCAKSSLAYKEGFLERPIVNEYVEILWDYINYGDKTLERKEHKPKMLVSHDVDSPFEHLFLSSKNIFRRCVGDVVKRGSLIPAIKRFNNWILVRAGHYELDRFYTTFDRLMTISEKNNVKSEFYFFGEKGSKLDGDYNIYDEKIRIILRKIYKRGHQIGLHGTYGSCFDLKKIKREFANIKNICEQENIKQDSWGGRQHFLRISIPLTLQNYDDAGINYDSTISYHDHVGFRSGCCYEYPMFNVNTKKTLNLYERPLIIMDCSLIESRYMGLGYSEQALNKARTLKEICFKFNGIFTLLWHNNYLVTDEQIVFYNELLK